MAIRPESILVPMQTLGTPRLSEPGLDIIVVYGIETHGLPRLPEAWNLNLAGKAPPNSRILSYESRLDMSKEIKWQTFEQQSAGLLHAIVQEYQTHPETKKRTFCFIAYWLAGIVIKKTLYDLTQLSQYAEIVERTRGLIFIATPIITDRTAAYLGSLLRRLWRRSSEIPDFPRFSTCCKRFTDTELARRCLTLVCYESIEMKFSSRLGLSSHKLRRVDKDLVAAVPDQDNYFMAEIDCDLRSVFSETSSVVHDRISKFFTQILRQNGQTGVASNQVLDDWVHVRDDIQAAPNQTGGRITNNQDSFRLTASGVEQQSVVQRALLSPSSISSESTPQAVSLSSSERSYIFVPSRNDIQVKCPAVYVQNTIYETANRDFQGRQELVTLMNTMLSRASTRSTSSPRICVLRGPGGMGKTQTALSYFHKNKSQFDIALWLQANNTESLLTGYYQAAVYLGLHPSRDKIQQPDYSPKQVVDWLRKPLQQPSNPRSRRLRWLIVFDNVDDENVLSAFWPSGAVGSVILTTRDPMVSEIKASPGGHFGVDCLSLKDAVALLRRKLPPRLLIGEPEEVFIQLVQILGCWPLVIVQIAGNMQRLSQTPSRFLSRYQNEGTRYNYYDKVERVQDGYLTPLSSLWSLKDLDSPAARIISVISLLLPDSIPEFILEDTSKAAHLDGYPAVGEYDFAISQLERQSIVTRMQSSSYGRGREVSIHSVIQEVIRAQLLRDIRSFTDVFNATVRLLLAFWDFQSIPTTQYREPAVAGKPRWERCNMLLPHMGHVRTMFELLPDDGKRACATQRFFYMMNEAGWHHVLQRSLDEALDWANATLRYFKLCGADKFPMLRACQYATLSAVARARNQPDLACKAYEECFRINLEVYKQTKTITSQLVAAYTELGRVLILKGDLETADSRIKESIHLRKQMPNFRRVQLYSPIIFTSYIQVLRGQFKDAEEQLLQALKDREKEYSTKDDVISKRSGHILYCLGTVASKDGRFEEAYRYYQRSFSVFQQTGGDLDLDLAHCCYQLAGCYLQDTVPGSAQQMIDRAIETFSHHDYFEPYHARALYIKSNILHQMGDNQGAQERLADAAEIRCRIIPNDCKATQTLTKQDFDDLIPVWHQ